MKVANISLVDKNHQTMTKQPLPKDYLYPIHAISLNLLPEDKKIFDSNLKEVKNEFKTKVNVSIGIIIFSALLLVTLTYIQKLTNYQPFVTL